MEEIPQNKDTLAAKIADLPARSKTLEKGVAGMIIEANSEGENTEELVRQWMDEYRVASFIIIHSTGNTTKLINGGSPEGFRAFASLFSRIG